LISKVDIAPASLKRTDGGRHLAPSKTARLVMLQGVHADEPTEQVRRPTYWQERHKVMAVVRGDFVHFQIGYEGTMRRCLISRSALLIRERLDERDYTPEIILELFKKYQAEIERVAFDMAETQPRKPIIITTAEFNRC
jgi:hypothetical protein